MPEYQTKLTNPFLSYRADIDGLRAVAVCAVIIEHAGFSFLPAGYLGVDVFFVISGFLISAIIYGELQTSSFSLVNFYQRRMRRIMPALLFVTICCIVPSFFLMIPEQLDAFLWSAISASTFWSNILFWSEAGYFRASSELKPLLHTWSLSVEEQFYIFFPFILILFHKSLNRLIYALLILLFASFILNNFGGHLFDNPENVRAFNGAINIPEFSFYFVFTRLWELLFGALTFFFALWLSNKGDFLVKQKWINVFSTVGLCSIFIPMIMLDESVPSPSIFNLVPVLGTSLILFCGKQQNFVSRALALKPFVFLGLLSYSLYLWHQPIFAYTRLSGFETNNAISGFITFSLTSILAVFTYVFVERPFRNRKEYSVNKVIVSIFLACAFIITSSVAGIIADTSSAGLNKAQKYLAEINTDELGFYVRDEFNKHLENNFDVEKDQPRVLIIGDSQASDFFNTGNENGFFDNVDLSTHSISSACGIVSVSSGLSEEFPDETLRINCFNRRQLEPDQIIGKRIKKADVIILAALWKSWVIEYLNETINSFDLRPDQKLFIIGSHNFGIVTPKLYMNMSYSEKLSLRNEVTRRHVAANEMLKQQFNSQIFVDVQNMYCSDADTCPVFLPDETLISYDGTHLTSTGAKSVGEVIFKHEELAQSLGLSSLSFSGADYGR